MVILDILVSEQEMATLDEDIRPIWEEGGMICPADGCHSFLRTYSLCRKHWAEVYEKMVTMYTCEAIQECRFTTSRRNRVVRHIRKIHLSKQPVVGSKVTRNRKYQDPGSGLLPLQPVTEARSRYRTMLAERRRQEASSRATSTLERRETNARYQEVIADGQNCYVVTSRLWGPASKKTVTKV